MYSKGIEIMKKALAFIFVFSIIMNMFSYVTFADDIMEYSFEVYSENYEEDFYATMTDSLEFMDSKTAESFIGFIYNRKMSNVTDENKSTKDLYNYLTGNLERGSEEYYEAQYTFINTASEYINSHVTSSESMFGVTTDNLIKMLEKKAGGASNLTDEIVNQELSKLKKSVKKIVGCVAETDELILTIDSVLSAYKNVTGTTGKIESYLESVEIACNSCNYVIASENMKIYNYYLTYLNNRHLESGVLEKKGTLPAILSMYEWWNVSELDGAAIFLQAIGFGNSWTDNDVQRLARVFAEFTYHSINEYKAWLGYDVEIGGEHISSIKFIQDTYETTKKEKIYTYAIAYPITDVPYTLTFSSSNTAVAKVTSNDGVGCTITPISAGTAYIYAKASNGVTGQCKVVVSPVEFQIVDISNYDLKYSISNGEVSIEKYNGYEGEYIHAAIPDEIDGYPVTKISPYAFESVGFETVIIPEIVKSIGAYSFYDNPSLQRLVILGSTTTIGEGAFDWDIVTDQGIVGDQSIGNVSVYCDEESVAHDFALGTEGFNYTSLAWDGTTWGHQPSNGVYNISTPNELSYIRYIVNNGNSLDGYKVEIKHNINLNSKSWIPIGISTTKAFKGDFEGNGYTVSNLYTANSGSYGVSALFGYVNGSGKTFSDINLTGSAVSATYNAGLIAILNVNSGKFTIRDIHCKVATSGGLTGGVIAQINTSDGAELMLENCVNSARISTWKNIAGGVVGRISGTGSDKYNFNRCGNDGVVYSCFSQGYGDGTAGGMIGVVSNGDLTVSECAVAGEVYAQAYGPSCGGMIGYMTPHSFVIENCEVFAYINSKHTNGDCNEAGLIGGCYSSYYNSTSVWSIKNTYVSSVMEGAYGKAGLVINNESGGASLKKISVTNCYFDLDKTSINSDRLLAWTALLSGCNTISDKVISSRGYSSSTLRTTKSIYENWDFDSIWEYAESGYPKLKAFDYEPCADHPYEYTVTTAPKKTSLGTTKAFCPLCRQSYSYSTYLSIDDGVESYESDIVQSSHNYLNNMNSTWTISRPDADYINITFSSSTFVEDSRDYIYIYDSTGKQIGRYTGSTLAGKTIFVVGNKITINLVTDSSITKYGFAVTCIETITTSVFGSLESDGTLRIYGTGEMYNFSSGNSPWQNNTSVKKIIIEDGVESIGNYAFYGCANLTEVEISDSVKSIGKYAFYNCSSLSEINITDNIQIIGDYSFYGCKALRTITIGNNVNEIGQYAFYNSGLNTVNLGSGVEKIGSYAFGNCSSLTSVNFGDNLKYIDAYAFYYCTSLYDLRLPEGLESFGDGAFMNCTSLRNVQLPSTLKSMGMGGFFYCMYLESVTIPASVSDIQLLQFAYCLNLMEIKVSSENKYYSSINGILYDFNKTKIVCYPANYPLMQYVIPEGVESIEQYAFAFSKTTSVTVPGSVKVLGEYAFGSANYLKELVLSEGVKTIKSYALGGCTSLTYITIPDSVTSIDDNVFSSCSGVTIKCNYDSYASNYAINNNINYVVMCYHVFSNYVSDNNATCCDYGTKTAYCDNGCGVTDVIYDIEGGYGEHTDIFWYVVVEPTFISEGEKEWECDNCLETGTVTIDKLSPELTMDNYIVTVTGAEYITAMRYASGEHTTASSIKNSPDRVDLSASVIAKNTVDGKFVYKMPDGGYYTFWMRMSDGTEYLLSADMTKFTPTVDTYGVKITVDGLYDVKDFFIAKGEFNSYNEIKNNGYIVRVTDTKIAGKHSYEYTVSESGMHTVLVRYNDGREFFFHEELTVDEPVFTTNGLQVTIGNIPDVKVIRTAYGEYNTPGDTKRAEGARNFSNKAVIKDAEEYTLQYREEGRVTIVVEYNNGYVKVFHYDVVQKTPTVEQDGNTVTFGNLDGLKMVRYAMGEYTTAAQIKRAPGSKVIKPDAIVDGKITIADLAVGTYSFCVQYDDESYNYYSIEVVKNDEEDPGLSDGWESDVDNPENWE